ncbi:MAG TPA: AAA family ATPase [Polyangiaceae bacterium]|jgi:MoxR-like ATPase
MSAVTTLKAPKQTAAHADASAPTISVAQLSTELAAQFPERGDVIRMMLVAAVAGEHVVVLGPPGTAKSLLARSLSKAFGASYFERLMTRFTTPEEVFGPVKLSGLQQDRFTRATAGYLPSAEVVFLDEVFKANSAILNALLTALNERLFHDDGAAQPIPLLTCIAASNELPEGPELDALYDRFLVRLETRYIADRDAFRAMLTAAPIQIASRVAIRAEQSAARAVVVSNDTIDALISLRDACAKAKIVVSDRRWRQCLSVVRAAAHIDGRTTTEPEDLDVLEHVLWRKPDEQSAVARLVQSVVNPNGAKAVEELDAARDLVAKLPTPGSIDAGAYMSAIGSAAKDVAEILARVERLTPSRKVTTAKTEIAKIKRDVAMLAMRAAGIQL